MNEAQHTIWLKQQAPVKPALGQVCNGCGVCCTAEPCPVARVFLWQRHGACRALQWQDTEKIYRCGLLVQPRDYLRWLRYVLKCVPLSWQTEAEKIIQRVIRRWIASGIGCDSDAEILAVSDDSSA